MPNKIKRLIPFLLIVIVNSSVAQVQHMLVRFTPTVINNPVTLNDLNKLAATSTDTAIIIGQLQDGSGIIIFSTNKISWPRNDKYSIYTSPLNINYNVLCKVAEAGIPLPGTFIQYNTHITKFNVQQVPQLQNMHYNYLKQLKNIGSVLLEGHFNNDDGGFMLVEGKIEDEVINSDPTIQSGFIIPEFMRANFVRSHECE